MSTLLQIVPRIPGEIDGVGDYALTIARKLADQYACSSIFATFKTLSATTTGGFDVMPLNHSLEYSARKFDRLLLHYVNYGFQKRGVPFRLLSILQALRKQHRGKLVTIFHELYASGWPWRSSFWLQPLQILLAKRVARLSDSCIVSSDNFLRELRRLAPGAPVELHPVPSGFEEPSLSPDQIANRDPHQWVILGGTALVERSLRSLRWLVSRIPAAIVPQRLFVLGGNENPVACSLIADLGIESIYRPRIPASEASSILRTCSFVWFDYFHRPGVETSVVLKSSAFAAACAHAVIPVFPHCGSVVEIEGDRLPGPFFVEPNGAEVPEVDVRAKVATEIYDWYQRRASSELLVRGVASTLSLIEAQ